MAAQGLERSVLHRWEGWRGMWLGDVGTLRDTRAVWSLPVSAGSSTLRGRVWYESLVKCYCSVAMSRQPAELLYSAI